MSWHLGRLAAFDLETTGTDTEQDRIVTAAIGLVGGGQPSDQHTWLVDPGVEIPAGATAVHGISTAQARAEGRSAVEAVAEITALLAAQVRAGVPIVAFNARFDLTILDREARRYGLPPLIEQIGGAAGLLVIDPHVIDKQVDRFRKGKRTLTLTAEHYGVPVDGAHTAGVDALAAARVAFRLGQRVEELRAIPLAELHAEQVRWAAEQAASLQEYFQRQGREELVEGAWPLVQPQPLPVAA